MLTLSMCDFGFKVILEKESNGHIEELCVCVPLLSSLPSPWRSIEPDKSHY